MILVYVQRLVCLFSMLYFMVWLVKFNICFVFLFKDRDKKYFMNVVFLECNICYCFQFFLVYFNVFFICYNLIYSDCYYLQLKLEVDVN